MWSVRKWLMRRESSDLEEARRERELSERRYAETQVTVTIPLSEMRDQNHIIETVAQAIRRRGGERS